jgi:demethylmenaquinone methyltransferase / 2-methoxy-6-polyprenyl-1,4-benzoquinol methylase
MTKSTHFGFQQVPEHEKARKVAGVFSSVAGRYDVMNDLMSGGLHRLWKRVAVDLCAVRPGARVLDIAGGTGDLSLLLARRAGPAGQVCLTDINGAMLALGRTRCRPCAATANGCRSRRSPSTASPWRSGCAT